MSTTRVTPTTRATLPPRSRRRIAAWRRQWGCWCPVGLAAVFVYVVAIRVAFVFALTTSPVPGAGDLRLPFFAPPLPTILSLVNGLLAVLVVLETAARVHERRPGLARWALLGLALALLAALQVSVSRAALLAT